MWVLYSFLNAFFDSLKSAFGKRASQVIDPYSSAWASRLLAAPVFLPVALLIDGSFTGDGTFWTATVGAAAINTVATILFMASLRDAPLSLALQLTQLTPVFLLATSPIMTGEIPTVMGFIGVLVTVFGTYMLNVDRRRESLWAPFASLWRESGSRRMLAVAALYSVSSPLDKIAAQHASALWYLVFLNAFLAVSLAVPALLYGRFREHRLCPMLKLLTPVGLFEILSIGFQMQALMLAPVPYVITGKRASALFGLLWGKLFFHEDKMAARITGAICMFIGIALILFSMTTSGR